MDIPDLTFDVGITPVLSPASTEIDPPVTAIEPSVMDAPEPAERVVERNTYDWSDVINSSNQYYNINGWTTERTS